MGNWTKGITTSLLSLLVLLFSLEFGIRVYDAVVNDEGFFSTDKRNQLTALNKFKNGIIPFRTFGFDLYKEKEGVLYISSRHGELFSIEKPKGVFRIVCFGGSTTEQKIGGEHYPLVLQSMLRERSSGKKIEVINVGNSAYATPHLLILLELDVVFWKPDLIILSENINDLSVQWWPNFIFDYSNKYGTKYYTGPDYAARYSVANLIFKHSRLYWFIKSRIESVMKREKSWPIMRKFYGDAPNPMAVRVFESNLRSFIILAESNGIKVLLSTQPLQSREDYFVRQFAYKPYNNQVLYPLHDEFLKHHKHFNSIIKKIAMDTGVLFLDNNQAMEGKGEYFIDSIHYTQKGIHRLANNYADFLLERNVINDAD